MEGGGGRAHLCHLHNLNITVVHNIFHHGSPLISHDDPPPHTFVVSSRTCKIECSYDLAPLYGFDFKAMSVIELEVSD